MEIKEPYRNKYYRVMEVTFNSGEAMPLHEATSDAFIIVKDGIGRKRYFQIMKWSFTKDQRF